MVFNSLKYILFVPFILNGTCLAGKDKHGLEVVSSVSITPRLIAESKKQTYAITCAKGSIVAHQRGLGHAGKDSLALYNQRNGGKIASLSKGLYTPEGHSFYTSLKQDGTVEVLTNKNNVKHISQHWKIYERESNDDYTRTLIASIISPVVSEDKLYNNNKYNSNKIDLGYDANIQAFKDSQEEGLKITFSNRNSFYKIVIPGISPVLSLSDDKDKLFFAQNRSTVGEFFTKKSSAIYEIPTNDLLKINKN